MYFYISEYVKNKMSDKDRQYINSIVSDINGMSPKDRYDIINKYKYIIGVVSWEVYMSNGKKKFRRLMKKYEEEYENRT